jgi:hypothetical protein
VPRKPWEVLAASLYPRIGVGDPGSRERRSLQGDILKGILSLDFKHPRFHFLPPANFRLPETSPKPLRKKEKPGFGSQLHYFPRL